MLTVLWLPPYACVRVCRERVRGIYELGGVGGDVPTDMPRALRVGQSVVARHPATRMAADGIVLTIKPSKYRVQFNRCVCLPALLLTVRGFSSSSRRLLLFVE